ncbi:Two-component response regulator, FixJ family, consists of REC and HTH domains [Neorhodopirellula lusitana]|uniref:Two-component response regulator, FixJ family, consists of REC and HTH domains n=1 Tax=Neorhodopirellula lusitana TaxID=445327 RepID=A0ABY1QCT9_9BACT|nr:response regulator [Neorhodopirellula lusitana]SMP66927.1 Two-component response regulator, FixJ family, consists of REC and HTH domains [Neorhodopirellula lusitana]
MLTPTAYIVDDDEIDRSAMTRILRKADILVEENSHPQSFLESLDSIQVGCLIVDVNMPGLDGPALQRQIISRGRSLPVILASGATTIPVATEAMRLGALDVLEKPVDGDTLVALVRRGFSESARAIQMAEMGRRVQQEMETLTPKELEVLPYVCEGYSLKGISAKFGFGFTDAARHQAQILEKLNSCNAIQLLRRFQNANIRIDSPDSLPNRVSQPLANGRGQDDAKPNAGFAST